MEPKKFPVKLIVIIVLVVAVLVVGMFLLIKSTRSTPSNTNNTTTDTNSTELTTTNQNLTTAQQQFQKSWKAGCEGTGPVTLTHQPMNESDYSIIIPLGLLAGAHVTPIDHLYFSPKDQNSKRDAYPVYAMADGYIIDIGRRSSNIDTGEARAEEFRLTFQHSCTFFTYFDLVTSLTPEIRAAFPKLNSGDYASGHYQVRAGQIIGYIGGQTLDTAVYNLDLTLSGFITPSLYDGEGWKIHTDDFFKYWPADIKAKMLAKNVRKAEPRSGKIDYDINGKLIGNWFKVNTKGYIDNTNSGNRNYWEGHLAIVPNLYDPTYIQVSIGNWNGSAKQFAVKGNKPDPAKVGIGELVKYELIGVSYVDSNGQSWIGNSYTSSVKGVATGYVQGVALFELTENQKLKAEFFPGKTASQVTGFTSSAIEYYR